LKFGCLPPKVRPVPNQPVWKTYHVVTLVVAVATCLFTASLIGQLLSRFVWAFEPKSREEQFVLQITGTFFGLQIGGLICFRYFLKWHGVGWREGLGLGKPIRMALIAFVACAAFLPVAWGLQQLMQWALLIVSKLLVGWGVLREAIRPELQSTVLAIQEKTTPVWQSFALGILAVALAPVIEELMFRGILYRWIRDRGRPCLALWGSALLFGAIHFNLLAFLPLTLFGVLLAWLYQRSGNLLLPIFTHAFFNLINLLAILYQEPLTRWLESQT
jgi:membrane protease YdiL (CAAX protease family)